MPNTSKPAQQYHSPMMLVVLVFAVAVLGLLFSGIVPQLEAPSATQEEAPQSAAAPQNAPPPVIETRAEPRFDVVRVDADGRTVVAGQAAPNAKVSVVVDGQAVAAADADAGGNFVLFVELAEHDAPRIMWLMAETENGTAIKSADTVVIAPRAPAEPTTQVASLSETADQGGAAAAATKPAEGDDGSAPVTETAGDGAAGGDSTAAPAGTELAANDAPPSAPRVLLSNRDGVQALDTPALEDGAELRVDSLDYAADGAVTLRGQTAGDEVLRATLDGQTLAEGAPDASGQWSLSLPDVAAGTYVLKVERVDSAGQVVAQTEMPFRREEAAVVNASLEDDTPARVVTVQPGATLWAIARDRYGDGVRYVQVFQANRDLIRNPDLIYPGQVFNLPDDPAAAR